VAVEPFQRSLREIGMTMCPPRPEMEVLDVGCGTGSHLAMFQEAGCTVHGLDLSPAMLAKAKQRLGNDADLRLGDAAALPWPDASFDLVVTQTFLHELDRGAQTAVLSEMRRVVRSDGRVLIVDHRPGSAGLRPGLLRVAISTLELIAGWRHYRAYRSFMAAGGLPRLVAATPFTVEREKAVAGGNLSVMLLVPA